MSTSPRTLTGLAIGDALGMPFEMKEHTDPVLESWDGKYHPCPDSHPFCKGLKAGQWTDDTKMALALSNSLRDRRTYDPADAAAEYLAWYRSNDWRGIGTATKKAMEVLDRGGLWMESGTPGAEGNGTAMRIAPLGLFLRNRRPALIAACARFDAGITHDSIEAREGSVIVALAVSYLTKGRPREELVDWLLDCGSVHPCKTLARVREVGYYVKQIENSTPSAAVAIAANVLKAGGHVVETVPAALFCFLATNTFGQAVELAVRAGGDTDTTAAVTGALAGTHYGSDGTHVYARALERAHDLTMLDQALFSLDKFA